jgi:hypothetical protein
VRKYFATEDTESTEEERKEWNRIEGKQQKQVLSGSLFCSTRASKP